MYVKIIVFEHSHTGYIATEEDYVEKKWGVPNPSMGCIHNLCYFDYTIMVEKSTDV